MTKMPVLFISHGSPMVALENDAYTRALEQFGKTVARPKAIVAVSAHWEAGLPLRVTTGASPSVIYDFGGFPDELYRLTYPAPGDPTLAADILRRLAEAGIAAEPDAQRGWDHGVWVPLRRVFPSADIPVVEITLPIPRSPQELEAIGAVLAPLREQRVLLFGTGGVVHNLRLLHFGDKDADVDNWAEKFDTWTKQKIEQRDLNALRSYRGAAPQPRLAVPTTEHFDPLFFALGAARDEKPHWIYEGFHYGNLSMRSFFL